MHYCTLLLIIIIGFVCIHSYTVIIDASVTREKFKQFWKSTGLCPPDPKERAIQFLLSPDETINLALIGSLPNNGIKQVRIHWLLNLINQSKPKAPYNFTYLDNLIGHLAKYDLRPGFELMGQPITSYPDNLTYVSSINWTDIVQQIATRYIDKYGPNEVNKWRFETWNEPDLRTYNLLNFTLAEYLDYVASTSKGLRNAFASRNKKGTGKLGGPAGLFKSERRHPLCWGMLDRCNSLGKARCPLQYISFHRKGDGTAGGLLNATMELLDILDDKFPNLKDFPIANDEADLLKTWSKPEEWRADVRYAANVVEGIAAFYESVRLDRRRKIEVWSNDNGFLNYHPFYFTQRTLFARFQMNNTQPPHLQFIKKPAYSVMGMLSYLKGEFLMDKGQIKKDPYLTVLATKYKRNRLTSIAVVMSYANGTTMGNVRNPKNVNLTINNLPDVGGKYVIYVLDNVNTNPYQLWVKCGSPFFPDEYARRIMRNSEEPYRLSGPTEFKLTNITISILMSMPSVALIHLCTYGDNYRRLTPGNVYELTIFNITRNEILLTWKFNIANTPCIRTFEVEQSARCPDLPTAFRRVNQDKDTVFLSYHYAPRVSGSGGRIGVNKCEPTRGKYRVRAVDYWEQAGPYSEIVYYP